MIANPIQQEYADAVQPIQGEVFADCIVSGQIGKSLFGQGVYQ